MGKESNAKMCDCRSNNATDCRDTGNCAGGKSSAELTKTKARSEMTAREKSEEMRRNFERYNRTEY